MADSSPTGQRHGQPRRRLLIVMAYLVLLALSHLIRSARHGAGDDDAAVTVQAVDGGRRVAEAVRLTYREYRPDGRTDLPSSPGRKDDFDSLAPQLARTFRVIAPDLPGFGHSTRHIPDYSIRAHADYVLQMMDRLGVRRAHVVGFSMGGGVALHLADQAPDRVASLTMLSAIGVQEMEMLGDYHLNHLLHGLQLAGLWLLSEATPHMGWLDDKMIGMPYARNFYDSDQRPLREAMARYEGPALIIHGGRDVLVPVAAAVEHHRLLPQSDFQLFDNNHFMVFTRGPTLADSIDGFIKRVDWGLAPIRANADPFRLAQAAEPFNPAHLPKAVGIAAIVLATLIGVATLLSEDLACIGAGVLVAQGRIDFVLAALACCFGIFAADLLRFGVGRGLGGPALKRAPMRWFIRARSADKHPARFSRRGLAITFASRFAPGARRTADSVVRLLDARFWWFALSSLPAGVVWSLLLVGLSDALGGAVIKMAPLQMQAVTVKTLAAAFIVFVAAKVITRLSTRRGRRLL